MIKKYLSHKEHKEYTDDICNQINKLIKYNKISLAKKMIIDYLQRFPSIQKIKILLAICLIKEKNYEQAIKTLEELPEDMTFIRLTSLYFKLGNEEKLLELYQKYYQNLSEGYIKLEDTDYMHYELMAVYLRKKFEPESLKKISTHDPYTQSQICCYNAQATLDLIEANYSQVSANKRGQYFSEKIDIEDLFYRIKKYISTNQEKGSIHKKIYERYDFYYPECGETITGETLDAVVAFTIIGSTHVVSMMPIKLNKDFIIASIEELDKKDNTEIELIPLKKSRKPKTGLERFNQRYGTRKTQ